MAAVTPLYHRLNWLGGVVGWATPHERDAPGGGRKKEPTTTITMRFAQ
jgi:hypothetical protein